MLNNIVIQDYLTSSVGVSTAILIQGEGTLCAEGERDLKEKNVAIVKTEWRCWAICVENESGRCCSDT